MIPSHSRLSDMPLVQAVFESNVVQLSELIAQRTEDVNTVDSEKRTALHAAAYRGQAECITVLIQAGGKVNMKDSSWLTPLHHAAAQGHVDAVRELLFRQADVMARDRLWMTPFHLAAHNNQVKCAGNAT
jgi:ankyrin repeat protein